MLHLAYFMEIRMPHFFRMLFLVMVSLTVFLGMGTFITHLSGDTESSLLAITALVSLFLTGKVHCQMTQQITIPTLNKHWAL